MGVAIVKGRWDDQGAVSLTSMFDLRCSRDVPPRIGKQSVIICLAQAMPTVRGQRSFRARRLAGAIVGLTTRRNGGEGGRLDGYNMRYGSGI
jgi:hypothetical protein